jgi:hypothetical protein
MNNSTNDVAFDIAGDAAAPSDHQNPNALDLPNLPPVPKNVTETAECSRLLRGLESFFSVDDSEGEEETDDTPIDSSTRLSNPCPGANVHWRVHARAVSD